MRFVATISAILALLTMQRTASAEPCQISGPRYNLTGDTVHWAMQIESGHSCIRGLRFANMVFQGVQLVSRPQSGQIELRGSAFSYSAGADKGWKDSFSMAVAG